MPSYSDHYERLNKQQREAVDKTEGALLVLAGPGTGKTQLLSIRAANLILNKGISPENVLILTFTNAAARAMRERLARIVGPEGYNVEVETFHSFANSVVLESEGAIRFVKDKIEIGEVEKVRAIEYLLDNLDNIRDLRPFGAPYIHRGEIEKKISEMKNEGIRPGELKSMLKGIKPDGVNLEDKHIARLKELASIYEHYEKLKDEDRNVLFDERGRIDYDDMILVALEALAEEPVRDEFRSRYKYIMVDEYQDTNGAQLELLFSILDPGSNNICCVGDDDQAIYRFQGATLSNFRELTERVAGLETITLKNNYRSSSEVVDLSSRIIAQVPEDERISVKDLTSCRQYDKGSIDLIEFLTEEEELAFLVREVKRQAEKVKSDSSLTEEERKAPYNNIAVLVRKRAHILKVVDAFLTSGVPYATDGQEDIRSEKRVRQMMDILELASFESDASDRKSLALFKVLVSDYICCEMSDVLKFVAFVNDKKRQGRKEASSYKYANLFQQFLQHFSVFEKDPEGRSIRPGSESSKALDIANELDLGKPESLHLAAWAIERLLSDAADRPVHDILMQYIEDIGLYRYILKLYETDKVLRLRDLRSLVSFVNMIKQADLSRPGIGIVEFMREMNLRENHGMPVKGQMATLSQDGVRVYTSHAAKGLEFYSVFLPFSLEGKSWPVRRKGEVIRIPSDIYTSREKVEEKNKIKLLDFYDEIRLFYVASTRAKANLFYTATPAEKSVTSRFFEKMNISPKDGAPKDEEEFLTRFLKTEKTDPFAGTEDVLRDLTKSLTLNPTSLNNYIECRRKFLYDNVLRLPGKKNQHLVFGNCAHKALEDVYSSYMENNTFPKFDVFEESFNRELEYEGGSSAIKGWCLSKLEGLKGWYSKESASPVMPLDLENKLEVAFPGGLTFRGTFDKIEEDEKDTIRVIDYKTGKPDKHVKAIANCHDLGDYKCDDYYRQLIAYKMLYEKALTPSSGKTVSKGVLQFLEPVGASVKKYDLVKGQYRSETVILNDDMVSELEKIIMRTWRSIQDLEFSKLPERDGKQRCGRCEYDNICWGGA